MDNTMQEFVDIVTTSLRDVHINTNKVIRENSSEVINAEIEPIVLPYGAIYFTFKIVIDDGEEFFYGPDY
ncbi:MAG: hypothetical protein CMQ02_10320 [Gammaproteobacteria bacterium]|nr:hypothetical protein [Gammaproteobacteria bacterium]